MNIFVVNSNPRQAAHDLCDKHVVKMIVESAQMLSTAHRVLDGKPSTRQTKTGRNVKDWVHPDSHLDMSMCFAVMVNHPCTRWAMENDKNYLWLQQHAVGLLDEYTIRYGKIHSMDELIRAMLSKAPAKSPAAVATTPFAQAMPDQYRNPDAVTAYRNYYMGEKRRFAAWKTGHKPYWWKVEQ
jgi:hypothetical protein